MIGSIAVWGLLPLFKMNISTRSVYESEIHKFFFFSFAFTFICLLKLGGLPPTYYYVQASKIFTFYYFIYFLIIIPNLYLFEGPTYYSQKNKNKFGLVVLTTKMDGSDNISEWAQNFVSEYSKSLIKLCQYGLDNNITLYKLILFLCFFIIIVTLIYYKSTINNLNSKYFYNQNMEINYNIVKIIIYILSFSAFLLSLFI